MREELSEKYQDSVKTFRSFRPPAEKNSDVELEREIQESRWSSGGEMDPVWYETLRREQEAIMNVIRVERKKETSSSTGVHSSERGTESRRGEHVPTKFPANQNDEERKQAKRRKVEAAAPLNGSHDADLLHPPSSPSPPPPQPVHYWKPPLPEKDAKYLLGKPIGSKTHRLRTKLDSSKHEAGSPKFLSAGASHSPSSSSPSTRFSSLAPDNDTSSPAPLFWKPPPPEEDVKYPQRKPTLKAPRLAIPKLVGSEHGASNADSSKFLTAGTSHRSRSPSTRSASPSTRSPSPSARSSSNGSSGVSHRPGDIGFYHTHHESPSTENRLPSSREKSSFDEPFFFIQPPSPSLSPSIRSENRDYDSDEQQPHHPYRTPLSSRSTSSHTASSTQVQNESRTNSPGYAENKRRKISNGESEVRRQHEAQPQEQQARRRKGEKDEGMLLENAKRLEQDGQISDARETQKKKNIVSRLKDAMRLNLSPDQQKKGGGINAPELHGKHANEPARKSEEKLNMHTRSASRPSIDTLSTDIHILSKLGTVLKDKEMYKKFLSCTESDAQTALDVLQMLLDTRDMEGYRRGQLITAMRRLSKETQLFPLCYNIPGPLQVRQVPSDGGGYADIYEARIQNERLCLKVIRAYAKSTVVHIAKVYAREAITWGQLYHPNVLPFYGLHTFRSQISLVAPWAENGQLGTYLKRNPNSNRVLLCADAAAGLSYLHKHSVVHGDIKAANVLIDRSGRACLADLGLSSVTDPEIVHWTSQSSVASKGGSTRWQAPELLEPESDDVQSKKVHNSKASDVFAWACLCYEAFIGKLPFYDVRTTGAVISRIIRGKHPTKPLAGDPAWIEWGLTTDMWSILEDCWKFEPQERPDISAVIMRLEPELPMDTRPPPQWQGRHARDFRCWQSESHNHRQPTLEDLDVILSQILLN